MSEEEIIKGLDIVINNNKDKVFMTGKLNYVAMAESCKIKILDLQNQLKQKENIIKKVREYLKFLKKHYKELRTSPVKDSYFINDMLRQMFIQSIENYLVGIEDILDKEVN